MKKKKFDLTTDIVDIQNEPNKTVTISEEKKDNKKNNVLMTISVDENTRRDFKAWCANNGLKMNEAFIEGFKLLIKDRST